MAMKLKEGPWFDLLLALLFIGALAWLAHALQPPPSPPYEVVKDELHELR